MAPREPGLLGPGAWRHAARDGKRAGRRVGDGNANDLFEHLRGRQLQLQPSTIVVGYAWVRHMYKRPTAQRSLFLVGSPRVLHDGVWAMGRW